MKQAIKVARNEVMAHYHRYRGFLAATHFDYPASSMTVIGVTGTNGKTSTCFMIYNVLRQAGLKAAMMTTVRTSVMGEDQEQLGHMTTADTKLLNKKIASMRDAGVQYLVLEVSSHALEQGRIFGVPIDIAVMTNVTPEHLDYHRTFKRYRNAKLKLFKMLADNAKRGGRGIGIVNADDPSAKWFELAAPRSLSYGIQGGQMQPEKVKLTGKGVSYDVVANDEKMHIEVNIPGEPYVYNSLAAVAVCSSLGIDKKDIEKGIASLQGVDGRMSHVDIDAKYDVIVDYAHTPDAYAKVLPSIKKSAKGRVFVIAGAAGDRDNSKFAEMGRIAGDNADVVILTEEDPGKHNVRKLSELVAKGVRKAGKEDVKDLLFIDDRREAIKHAMTEAQAGDIIMLLGMGHEKVIDRKNGPEPWNDYDVAVEIFAELSAKGKKKAKSKKK